MMMLQYLNLVVMLQGFVLITVNNANEFNLCGSELAPGTFFHASIEL